MKKRIVSFLIVLVMVMQIMPLGQIVFAAAVAATPGETRDVNTIGAGNNWNITQGGTYTLIGTTANNSWITVNTNAAVTINLNGVSINNPATTGVSPLQLSANANLTLNVMNGTTNSFICNGFQSGVDFQQLLGITKLHII